MNDLNVVTLTGEIASDIRTGTTKPLHFISSRFSVCPALDPVAPAGGGCEHMSERKRRGGEIKYILSPSGDKISNWHLIS